MSEALNNNDIKISDKSIDHYFDAYIVPLNHSFTNTFGLKYNDITIRSQLIDTDHEDYLDYYSLLIANFIQYQSSRYDPTFHVALDIDSIPGASKEFIKHYMFDNDKSPQQTIIIRYQPTNIDKTNLHF